mgnify:CR=1 FL=1
MREAEARAEGRNVKRVPVSVAGEIGLARHESPHRASTLVSLAAVLTSEMPTTMAVFTAIGLGMALPYVLLGAFPAWVRRLPRPGRWREVLNSDATGYNGAGAGNLGGVQAVGQPWHGRPASAPLTLPPLSAIWLTPE